MKYIFFLMLIPLILIPSAYGEVEKFSNYEKEIVSKNPDGTETIRWTQSIGTQRILDGTEYKDYIHTDNPNYIQIETMFASVQLDKNTCEFRFYPGGIVGGKSELFTAYIIPFQAIEKTGNFNKVNSLDNAACIATWDGQNLMATKEVLGVGKVDYLFRFIDYKWKTELHVFNDSVLNNREFGFQEVFELNRDSIKYGGTQRNLDNFDGSSFNREWLENNNGKVIDLLNGFTYDFDLGFQKLNNIFVNDTGPGTSRLTFEYFFNQTTIQPGETLIIDPTFSDDNPTEDGYITGNPCSTQTATVKGGTLFHGRETADICYRAYLEWDITTIPDTATVSDTVFKFDVQQVWGGGSPCDIYEMTLQPSTATNQQIFDDAGDDTQYVTASTQCSSTGNNKSIDLGTDADSDVEGQLASDWFAIGIKTANEVGGQLLTRIQEDGSGGTPDPTLEITYTAVPPVWSPGPAINPAATTTISNLINFTFTPDNATGVIGYALFNASSNSTNDSDWTWIINSGNQSSGNFTLSQLSFCEEMWLKTSAFSANNNGSNTTGVKGVSMCAIPNAVELLDGVPTYDQVALNWTQPSWDNGTLAGYQVNRTGPPHAETVITVIRNNTNSVVTSYTDTGLTLNTNYSYRVSPWTEYGNNDTGYVLNVTTLNFVPPNFTIGQIQINQTNTDIIDILFDESDINTTTKELDVIYSNSYNLTCIFYFQYAMTNNTYSNLASVAYSGSQDVATFTLVNVTNEIVNIRCYDENTGNDGRYQIFQSQFPLLDQIANFRDGTYGTMGEFGAFDFITIVAVILSMIGFNRVNETVGVIFNTAILGVLWYFEIIQIPTIIFSAISLVIILVVASTKKD